MSVIVNLTSSTNCRALQQQNSVSCPLPSHLNCCCQHLTLCVSAASLPLQVGSILNFSIIYLFVFIHSLPLQVGSILNFSIMYLFVFIYSLPLQVGSILNFSIMYLCECVCVCIRSLCLKMGHLFEATRSFLLITFK